jgi:ABC-type branched-subunit amino acid transport system ATPase component
VLDVRALKDPARRALLQRGVAYCPQGNQVFADLTVQDHLDLAEVILRDRRAIREGIARSLECFPALKPRLRQRAGTLSGAEKQMVAVAARWSPLRGSCCRPSPRSAGSHPWSRRHSR